MSLESVIITIKTSTCKLKEPFSYLQMRQQLSVPKEALGVQKIYKPCETDIIVKQVKSTTKTNKDPYNNKNSQRTA